MKFINFVCILYRIANSNCFQNMKLYLIENKRNLNWQNLDLLLISKIYISFGKKYIKYYKIVVVTFEIYAINFTCLSVKAILESIYQIPNKNFIFLSSHKLINRLYYIVNNSAILST